jgi:drug/metabolite transporter (DMT)-like permease
LKAGIPAANPPAPLASGAATAEGVRLAAGIAVGLVAASIGALYTVYARWGIARGMVSADLTALRFGTAGLATLPVLAWALRADARAFLARWRTWLLVAALAGTPFGLLMFGALQFAPPSHAAVFPFSAMSVAGLLLSAWVLGDPLSARRVAGIAVVVGGLVLLSGVADSAFTARAALGDLMFVAAGTLWAGFGIVLRRQRLDPLLATAVISFSALCTYVPVYLLLGGAARLLATAPAVLLTELLVQGLIAGVGTLYAYAKMVSLLGAARAAVFPALAPGLASLMAWPVLGYVPSAAEATGLGIAMAGLLLAMSSRRAR